jgi:hypothetical protein
MATGGPFRGRGSPPEGDFYTEDDLRAIARDTNAVLDEVDPFTKLGHNSEQMLARRSGMYDDDQPATGRWRNFRVEAGKLVADWTGAPAKLARLFEAGAFGKRSVEFKPYESQKGRGKFDRVIRAVALLGAKAPAIKTLDDVVSLYGDDEIDDADLTVVEYAETSEPTPLDLRIDLGVEAQDDSRENGEGADTTGVAETPDTQTGLALSDEQRDSLAELLGVEGDVTVEALLARASEVRSLADRAETGDGGEGGDGSGGDDGDGDGTGDGGDGGEGTGEPARTPAGVMLSEAEYWDLRSAADEGRAANETLRVERRERLLEEAMRDGRIDPAQHDEFVRLYDENEDVTTRVLSSLRPNEDLARSYGSEDDSEPTEQEDALYREFGEWSGVAPTGRERSAA